MKDSVFFVQLACQSHMEECIKKAIKELVIRGYANFECQNQPDSNGKGEHIGQDCK